MSDSTKKTVNKKKIAIISILACLLVVGAVFGVKAFFGSSADEVKDKEKSTEELVNEYYDEEYEGKALIDVEDESVQDILECYENDELALTVNDDYSMEYTVAEDMKANVVSVAAAVCIEKEYEADIDEENTVILYLGSAENCKYDSESGKITSEYEYKTLMLNGKQPLAVYAAGTDGDKTLYYTPMYVNDEEEATLVTVSVDKDNKVTVVNRLKTVDDEGNELEEPVKEELKNGTVVCPAYENFIVKKATIDDTYINATEVYEADKTYEVGKDLTLTYETLPDGYYLYNYKVEYDKTKEDSEEENNEQGVPSEYCIYTEQQEIQVKDEKVVESKESVIEEVNIEDYKLLSIVKFLKLVWKNAKNVPKADMKQMYQHDAEGYDVQKGYISAWNSLDINKALRTDAYDELPEDDKKTVDVLQKHCMNNTFDENILAVRNVGANFLTWNFGTKLNGQDVTDELVKASGDEACLKLEKELQSTIVGKKITEKGFMSVSLVPKANIMIKRTVRLMIMAPKGTKAYTTVNVGESEAILPMNSNLVIKSVSYDKFKNKFIIYCLVEQDF